MYLIFSDRADEYTKIKATLGASAQRVSTRHSLLEKLNGDPTIRVVIISPSVKEDLAFELSESIRIQFPQVNLLLVRNRIDVSVLSGALESGIRDVIDAQDATNLVNSVKRCESIAETLSGQSRMGNAPTHRGRVITVYSAKGGCGKTTIASNLAASLSERDASRVCLVDLDLQFGDIATALRISPTKTISNALEMAESIDIEGLVKVLLRYEEKFDVLLAPTNPADIEVITTNFISRTISTLQRNYEYVVIDTSPSLNEITLQTLQESDLVLLITTLDMPAIKNMKLTLSTLDALGFPNSRRKLVLNKSDLRVGLSKSDVEELVGETVSYEVPSSIKVPSSTNDGQLVIYAFPRDPVSKAINHIAFEVKTLSNALSGVSA